jgi:hypothetical protein
MSKYNPTHPIYIPSKSRWDSRLTVKSLERMNVPYHIIVEKSQYEEYVKVINKKNILILPENYLNEYDTCDELGRTKSVGPGAARNFAWEHSISINAKWHWVMDDNIRRFMRFNNNRQIEVLSGAILKAMEDFCNRYENVTMAGPNYFMFVKRKDKLPPYILNTRIYSCNLIKNDAPYRWRGRYNEDTDLSLRMLKDGFVTIQFNAFMQHKAPTQTVPGGNSSEFYHVEGELKKGDRYADNGTLAKSEMLVKLHPDVSTLVYKFSRIHHHVDYLPFKKNKLIKKKGLEIKKGVNEYGMILQKIKDNLDEDE